MITVQDCLVIYDELGDCKKCSRVLAGKFRKEKAEEVAQVLLELVDEYEMEELVSEVLSKLDNCPINWFETVLDFDSKLSELYN